MMPQPKVTITQRIEIDAGHRLMAHAGKCRNYHGHRYVFLFEFGCSELPEDGMVLDFGVIKERIKKVLDHYWDHGMILQQGDPLLPLLRDTGMKVFETPNPPTAENLAIHAFTFAMQAIPEVNVWVNSVTCQETPNCSARYGV